MDCEQNNYIWKSLNSWTFKNISSTSHASHGSVSITNSKFTNNYAYGGIRGEDWKVL